MRFKMCLILLCLMVCISGCVPNLLADENLTPKTVTAADTLNIIGPEDPIDVKDDTWLRINGLTLDEIKLAKKKGWFDLTTFPLKGTRVHASYDWLNEVLELSFRSENPGDYLVKMHLVRQTYEYYQDKDGKVLKNEDGTPRIKSVNTKLEVASVVVTVKDGGEPEPPNPPDPPGPNPGGPYQVLLFHESSKLPELPRSQRTLLTSNKVKQEIVQMGNVLLGIYDVDSSDSDGNHGRFADWWEAIKQDSLPRIAIAPLEGGEIVDLPLPKDEASLIKLLKEGPPQ